MSRLSVPNTARLPSSLRLPAGNTAVRRSLSRLSRRSLIALVLEWLEPHTADLTEPFLRHDWDTDEDAADPFPAAVAAADLREHYTNLLRLRGSAREVADRIAEGDWRHGLTLYQLATADLRYLYDHPTALRWTAYHLVLQCPKSPHPSFASPPDHLPRLPRLHPSSFLQRLQDQVLPDSKAHFHFDRVPSRPLLVLRILVLDSPYNTAQALPDALDAYAVIYVAFPDAAPFVYVSAPQPASSVSAKRLHRLVIDGLPRAISRPRARCILRLAALASRNIDALLCRCGPGNTNAAFGPWALYATEERTAASPLDPVAPSASSSLQSPAHCVPTDQLARARFGTSAMPDDGQGVERVDILLQDPFSLAAVVAPVESDLEWPRRRASALKITLADDSIEEQNDDDEDNNKGNRESSPATAWAPNVRLAFHGSHVFAGLRQLVEAGAIDGKRMPGWMTGEDGVTVGAVRHGRIRGAREAAALGDGGI